jgi:hypothetical protein
VPNNNSCNTREYGRGWVAVGLAMLALSATFFVFVVYRICASLKLVFK